MPTIAARRLVTRDADERLAWLIVLATIPVGVTGLALEHVFRTVFAKPLAASVFLFVNGLILLAGERVRRTARADAEAREPLPDVHVRGSGGGPAGGGAPGRGAGLRLAPPPLPRRGGGRPFSIPPPFARP